MKTLIPIILLGLSIGLFVLFTNGKYQEVKVLRAEEAQYNDALTQASTLRQKREELSKERNTFSEDDVKKLVRLLPDNVDNIRLIIDIDTIAARHGLQVKQVALGSSSVSSGSGASGGQVSLGQGSTATGSADLGFAVDATYDNFIAFLTDLEQSVRIVDVESIKFKTSAGDLNTYSMKIKTYWLR